MIFKSALKDLKSNRGYFISYVTAVAFAIAIYFFFTNLAYNPSYQLPGYRDYLRTSEISSMSIATIATITKTVELIFIGLFLIVTSILFFKLLKPKMGQLLIAGFNKTQVSFFFAFQQFVVHIIALLLGVLIGILAVPVLNLTLIRLLGYHTTWSLVINQPVEDVLTVFLIVFIIQGIVSYIASRMIQTPTYFGNYANPKKNELKKRKLKKKPSIIFTLIELILFGLIVLSVFNFRYTAVWFVLLNILFLFIFFRFQIFRILEKRKRKKRVTDLNLITYSHLKRSLSDSTWTIIFIATATIAAMASLFIFSYGNNVLTKEVVTAHPTEFAVNSFARPQVEEKMKENALPINPSQEMTIKLIYYTNMSSGVFGAVSQSSYNQAIQQGFMNRSYPATAVPDISNSQLNAQEVHLKSGQLQPLHHYFRVSNMTFALKNGQSKAFDPVGSYNSLPPNPVSSQLLPRDVFVLSDEDFDQIQSDSQYEITSYQIDTLQRDKYQNLVANLSNEQLPTYYIVSNSNTSKIVDITSTIKENQNFSYTDIGNFSSYYIDSGISSYLFANLRFILIIFSALLISATQIILLLKLNTDFERNLNDYQSLVKLGNIQSDIKKLVFKYTAYYFLVPTLFVMVYMMLALVPVILTIEFSGYVSYLILCGLVIGFTVISYYAIYKNYWYLVKQKI